MRRVALFAALAVAMPLITCAQVLPDTPEGYVTDAAHVLSDATRVSLESELAALDASTTEQIAVVTVPDMGGDYIEHYAADLFQKWGIGQAKQDDGVLLLLSIDDHKLRIEVGYGLEGALPDSVANSIIQDDMVPLLKVGDYDGAVQKGVDDIVAAIRGEYAAPASVDSASSIDPETILFLLFFAIPWLAAIFGSSKSWWLGGVVGGVVGVALSTFLGWWMLGGAILTTNLVIFGLIFDYLASQNAGRISRGGTAGPWWTGGGGFGSSSSSGGFGGFGGGSSGGGGASGGW
jgi:uncharacterized protein